MKEEILYRVYVIHVKDADKYYVGITKQKPYLRLRYSKYTEIPGLWEYIKNDAASGVPFRKNPNIEIEMTEPIYTEEEARFIEDWFITAFKPGKCINTYRSNLIKAKDPKKYDIESALRWKKEHPKEASENQRRYNMKPENRIYQRVTSFNHCHPDRVIETPLEAKQKYLEWGYIPDYVKSDDLTAS